MSRNAARGPATPSPSSESTGRPASTDNGTTDLLHVRANEPSHAAGARNTSPCASLAHGHRLEGAALLHWLDDMHPGPGSLREAIEAGTWSVRYGVNDYVISFGDVADQSHTCGRDHGARVLELLVEHRHQLDVEPAIALAVWTALRDLVAHRHTDPTHAELATAAGISRGTTGRALQSLRRLKLVDWQHQVVSERQIANTYRVLDRVG